MPVLLQSVVRAVGLVLSKISTPLWISSVMTVLASLNKSSSSCVHSNLVEGFSNSRKGSIRSADENAYATWFIRPNQLRMSVMFFGVGKFWIASRERGHGFTDVGVTRKPANSTVLKIAFW